MSSQTKYVILLADGMADRAIEERGGMTPLMIARTPNLDAMASRGLFGMVRTASENLPPGSDIMNMNIMGYPAEQYYSGRSPFEAASMGIALEKDDIAFRVNLVTLRTVGESAIMDDYSAGHISTNHAAEIIRLLQIVFGDGARSFYPGKSYRHLMVWHDGPTDIELTPPHDIMGQEIAKYLPREPKLLEYLDKAMKILRDHPVNQLRRARGLKPANSIWFWGQGRKPVMPSFRERWGLRGAAVSAVDLIKGIGATIGLDTPHIEGATGYLDTNYEGKAKAALAALELGDFVFLHVEAPDEAGHNGDANAKIKAIEDFDEKIVGPVLEGLKKHNSWRALALPDHATPISVRTHVKDPVPFALLTSDDPESPRHKTRFEEALPPDDPAKHPHFLSSAKELTKLFFGKE